MKRVSRYLLFVILLTFVNFSLTFAQEEALLSKVKLSKTEYDFGKVLEGEQVTANFELENSGNAPLNIVNQIADCGCIVVSLEKSSILPGEKLPIKVDFDTRGFQGSLAKQVLIKTDNLDQEEIIFSVSGEIEPELKISPNKIFIKKIPNRELENQSEIDFQIQVNSESKATIDKITDLSQLLELKEPKVSAKRASFKASFLKAKKSGLYRERIVVSLKNGRRKSYNIPIFIKVSDPIELDPPVISFGLLKDSRKISKRLRIIPEAGLKLDIFNITSSSPAVVSSLDSIDKKTGVITLGVTLDPTLVTKDLITDLIIETNQQDSPEIRVNLFATIPPSLED